MLMFYMSLIDNDDDREKFEILYNKYRKRMVYTAYSVLGNNEDAEDAVHVHLSELHAICGLSGIQIPTKHYPMC